jgi:hypothetical protein
MAIELAKVVLKLGKKAKSNAPIHIFREFLTVFLAFAGTEGPSRYAESGVEWCAI